MYLLSYVNIWNGKYPRHLQTRCCLRHDIENAFQVNVDLMNSLTPFPSFLLDEVHLWHIHADATSLPASTLPWFSYFDWFDIFWKFKRS